MENAKDASGNLNFYKIQANFNDYWKNRKPEKARAINLLKDGNTIGRIELIRMEAFHRQILLQGPGLNTLGITEKYQPSISSGQLGKFRANHNTGWICRHRQNQYHLFPPVQ